MPPIMHPQKLPETILSDPKREAEIQVFRTLETDNSLNKKWHVFYSLDWIGAYKGLTRDGEADFVIAHPDIGFLVIEVKGGGVTIKPGLNWTSVDRNNETHVIDNGMLQAMKSKKVLLEGLLQGWGKGAPFIRGRHAVILPHSSEPDEDIGDLAKGMPRELFVFKGQMKKLGLRVRELLNWNAPGADDPIGMGGEKGLSLLRQLYGKEIELVSRLRDELDDVEQQILQLSKNQTRVLNYVRNHKRCVIQGPAGTGKTVIAKEKALKEVKRGTQVLFLCFNRKLRDVIEADLREELSVKERSLINVFTFHGYCRRISKRTKIEGETEKQYFNEILPNALFEEFLKTDALSTKRKLVFDSVIIDEGQDFTDDWLQILYELANLNSATISIFQDNNQCIYRDNSAHDILGTEPILLPENFRNSREIFDVVEPFVDDEDFVSLGPHGPSVRKVETDLLATHIVVEREIYRLIETEGIAPSNIVILSGSSTDNCSSVPEGLPVDHFSIWEFKGLDSPVVLLCDLDNAAKNTELAYVGVSRARSLLLLVDTPENLANLLSILPEKIRQTR